MAVAVPTVPASMGPSTDASSRETEPLMLQQPKYLGFSQENQIDDVAQQDMSHLDDEAGWLQEQRAMHLTLHWFSRPSIIMIGICLFILTFASSSAESSRQVIQYKLACNSVTEISHSNICDPTEAQILLLTLQQALQVTLGIATVIALAKVPTLSDQYGRKRFIILSVLCLLIGKVGRYLVTSCFPSTQFALMIVCEIISNLFGGIVTILALCNCYASDISEPNQRTHYLGIIMAFFFVGLSTGPMAGNLIISFFPPNPSHGKPSVKYGPNLSAHDFIPLRFELFMVTILLLFTLVVLPESRGQKARRMSRSASRSLLMLPKLSDFEQSRFRRYMDTLNIFKPLRIIFYPKDCVNPSRYDSIKSYRIAVIILIALDCTLVGFGMSLGEIFILFGIYRHKMTALDIGVLLIIGCSCRAIFLTVISPLLNKKLLVQFFGLKTHKRRFDMVDYGMVSIAFIGEMIGLIVLSLAPTKAAFLSCFVITAVGSIASPALTSSTIKFFPEAKIGEVFGAMALAKNAFNITFPLIFLGIYKYSLKKWQQPELVFYVAALIFFLLFVGASFAIHVLEKEEEEQKRKQSDVDYFDSSSIDA